MVRTTATWGKEQVAALALRCVPVFVVEVYRGGLAMVFALSVYGPILGGSGAPLVLTHWGTRYVLQRSPARSDLSAAALQVAGESSAGCDTTVIATHPTRSWPGSLVRVYFLATC